MPTIFDNITEDTRLGPALKADLTNFQTLDVATGYLDLRGWSAFADIIETKSTDGVDRSIARLLVGMVMPSEAAAMLGALQEQLQPPAYGSEINSLEKAMAAKEQLVRHLRTQLMRGIPNSAGQTTLQKLRDQLASGIVEMKVFTDAPLHGKTYLFHDPGNKYHQECRGYVGSSNLTAAGFYKNLELNIDVTDQDLSLIHI